MKRLALVLALPLAACSAINPFAGKSGVPDAPAITATTEVAQAWKVSVGGSGAYVMRPAIVGSSVFVASEKGTIARIDEGRETWRIQAGVALSAGVGANEARLAVGTAKGEVLAFSLDGKPLWRVRVSSEVLAPPVVTANLVLVRTADNRIHALDVKDGKRRWLYQRSTPALVARSSGSLIVTETVAYAGFAGGKLVAISLSNGGALWESTIAVPRGSTELERVADITSEPVIAGRAVCAVAFQGRLACVDRISGSNLWSREISSSTGLTASGYALFVSDEAGNVFGLDAEKGTVLWKQGLLVGRKPTRPGVSAGGVVVADLEGWVYFLNPADGNVLARAKGAADVDAPPLPLADAVVVQDVAGNVSAFAVK